LKSESSLKEIKKYELVGEFYITPNTCKLFFRVSFSLIHLLIDARSLEEARVFAFLYDRSLIHL